MNTLLLVLAMLAPTVPYTVVTQPDGTTASYNVDCGDPNKGLDSAPFTLQSGPPTGAGWKNIMVKGNLGWNGITIVPVDGVYLPTWPQYTGKWNDAWVQEVAGIPFGAYAQYGYSWPTTSGALTVKTNNSTIIADVTGSPCESLIVVGNNNKIHVRAISGVQSRLMLLRSAVVVNGNGNTVSGYSEHPVCALVVRGNNNALRNFTAVGGEVGDDSALIYFVNDHKLGGVKQLGYWNGAVLDKVSVIARKRKYPPSHLTAGIYADDKFSNVKASSIYVSGGFKYGIVSNGGDDVTINGLTTVDCEAPFKFLAHQDTPTKAPIGCSAKAVVAQ